MEELRSESERNAQKKFMKEITTHVGEFDPDRINTDIANAPDVTEEPIFANDFDDEPATPLTSNTPAPIPDKTPTLEVSGPEPLLNPQVYMAHGDSFEIAKVIG
jgi:hypothetical protein